MLLFIFYLFYRVKKYVPTFKIINTQINNNNITRDNDIYDVI